MRGLDGTLASGGLLNYFRRESSPPACATAVCDRSSIRLEPTTARPASISPPEPAMIFSDWSLRAGLAGICLGLLGSAPETLAGEVAARLTSEQHVRPILKAHCFACHGEEEKPKARLDVRLVRTMTKGGASGEAMVAGRHEESLLWERIEDDEMPPGEKKLTPAQKASIAAWIDQGAATVRPEPEALGRRRGGDGRGPDVLVVRPICRPEVPSVRDAARVRTPIDAFLLARLESEGLGFAPEADRHTLIRRITFDLTGLPPTPAEVEEFVADATSDALERVVDRLLATPQYGEHWARHWLDVAGYADSDGYTPKTSSASTPGNTATTWSVL